MADLILPDGPGYGVGIRYIGPDDPGAVGAYAVWLEIPVAGGPILHVRNAANNAWLNAGGGSALTKQNGQIVAAVAAPAAASGAGYDTMIPSAYYDGLGNAITAATVPADLGVTADGATGAFTVVRAGVLGIFCMAIGNAAVASAEIRIGGIAAFDQATADVPAAAPNTQHYQVVFIGYVAVGDVFTFMQKGTAAQTPLSYFSAQIARVLG